MRRGEVFGPQRTELREAHLPVFATGVHPVDDAALAVGSFDAWRCLGTVALICAPSNTVRHYRPLQSRGK
jgi:hypothetical protein